MVRRILLFAGFLFLTLAATAQTTLNGKVTDSATGEDLLGANVVLYKNGVVKQGAATDLDGTYSISLSDGGTYDVQVSYAGYNPQKSTGVVINTNSTTTLDFKLAPGMVLEATVIAYNVPLIKQDNTTAGATITSESIKRLPMRDISAMASTVAGVGSSDGNKDVSIKGSRTDATNYYVDGVRVSSRNLLPPAQDVDQLQVITGGIESQYGDVTGGIISVTTKGPSNKFTGGLEGETSKFLDGYNNNLVTGNLSGPILKRKSADGRGPDKTLLGFRVSGQYRDNLDASPSAKGVAVVNEDVLARLEANPLRRLGTAIVPTAQFLTNDSVTITKVTPNNRARNYNLQAKLDARVTDGIDVTFSGGYSKSLNQFTPDVDNAGSRLNKWGLLNYQRNPTNDINRYRGNFRFRHRLGNTTVATGAGSKETAKKGSLFQNASYIIQVGYEKEQISTQDPIHKNDFFNYGYVGQFKDTTLRNIQLVDTLYKHTGDFYQFTGFKAGTANPTLAAYNKLGTDVTSIDDLPIRNGRINATYQDSWQFRNVGQVYNRFSKSDNDIYTGSISSNFDIVPGSGRRHQIQFGINYEQRANRSYVLNPFALYYEASLLANYHFNGYQDGSRKTADGKLRLNVIGKQNFTPNGQNPVPVEVDIYARDTSNIPDAKFPYALRAKLGKSVYDYVNINDITPDKLSLDMFSSRELTDRAIVNYYGYDYLGNRVGNDVKFDDFFKTDAATGIRKFQVAPIQPIYAAAYIQDKFIYEKMIFRIGLRVDRYDANTKVMKDIYSLYEVIGAQDFFASKGGTAPSTVNSNDYKVYVNSLTTKNPSVVGYRKGDQWFDAKGNGVNDGKFIFNSEQPIPYYADAKARADKEYIKSKDFETKSSFQDYTPQVTFMPRLAFSFPISDEANFFANYDVLVSRPTSDNIATPLNYLYFYDASRTPEANPNLKPQKTIYYEVGFQQKLTEQSALKLTAYYKELRDMIQRRTVLFVPNITNYDTYGNIDFGTIKGFTMSYDRRRVGNVTLNASYTLQFADGTGSDANSQRNLTERGNLRTIYPLSYDERHNLNASIDYRFDSGQKYNGPRIAGVRFLENFGANLLVSAVSGSPYTAKEQPDRFGGTGTVGQVNGSRLPWKYRLDLRIDKDIRLSKNEKSGLSLNVYLRVQNLLNTPNIVGVYSASGSASNDGYLTSERGTQETASVLQQGFSTRAFLDAYNWALINPNFYTLPRRVFVGASFSF